MEEILNYEWYKLAFISVGKKKQNQNFKVLDMLSLIFETIVKHQHLYK